MLAVIREILHNEDLCTPFFEPYCVQFQKIIHAVAQKTSLYEVESCVILCDLVEEFLSSLVLSNSHTKHRVLMQKDNVIDWEFWIHVMQHMLSGENTHTQLRALAFLFNIWDNIPIGSSASANYQNLNDHQRREAKFDIPNETIFDLYADDQESLRWNCTVWLLSPPLWKRYFCHWHPLVRTYYLRLLCWRIASVGSESGLLSSVLFSNYNSDVRFLLEQRLHYTFTRFHELTHFAKLEGRPVTLATPCAPVMNRQLKIVFNPAASQTKPLPDTKPSRRIDPYEVFDDVAYSFPTVTVPSDLLSTPSEAPVPLLSSRNRSASTSAMESIGNTIKKRWSSIRGNSGANLKSFFNGDQKAEQLGPQKQYSDYVPSLTSSESTVSSCVRTPTALTPESPPLKADVESLPASLTMSLIPPPPQLLRKRPEVSRPLYKFCLEFSEMAVRKHRMMLRGAKKVEILDVIIPRIPFDSFTEYREGTDRVNRYRNGVVTHGNLNLGSDLYEDNSDEVADILSRYTNTDEDSSYEDDVVNGEFEYLHLSLEERQLQKSIDNDRHWKYAGRALNEWNPVVGEFETFVKSQVRTQGAVRLEDVGAPFLIAEIPAKALVG